MAEERSGFAGFESLMTDLSDLPAQPVPSARRTQPSWLRNLKLAIGGLAAVLALFSVVFGERSIHFNQRDHPIGSTPAAAPVSQQDDVPAPPLAAALEEKPPVGLGARLSSAQVRYCLSQGIRIHGANKAMDNTASRAEAKRYLELVDDYNRRCDYYRRALVGMPSTKEEVEARRAALELEGAALIRTPVDAR